MQQHPGDKLEAMRFSKALRSCHTMAPGLEGPNHRRRRASDQSAEPNDFSNEGSPQLTEGGISGTLNQTLLLLLLVLLLLLLLLLLLCWWQRKERKNFSQYTTPCPSKPASKFYSRQSMNYECMLGHSTLRNSLVANKNYSFIIDS